MGSYGRCINDKWGGHRGQKRAIAGHIGEHYMVRSRNGMFVSQIKLKYVLRGI